MRMLPRALHLLTACALLAGTPACRESKPPKTPEPAPEPAPDPEPAPEEPPETGDRAPMVPEDHPLYARVEGTSFENDCQSDADCHVGGCSSEVCSAEEGVNTTCEARDWPSEGGACGCVEGTCAWYRDGGAGEASALPGQGESCTEGGRCRLGLTCLEYYGVAGPRGPKLSSCEIRCGEGGACPDGQGCVTIADGPGRVCR